MMREKLTIVLFFLAVVASATTAHAQATEVIPTGGALGHHEFGRPPSRPLALNDTTMVIARPSVNAYVDRSTASLLVFSRILGNRQSFTIPVPSVEPSVHGIWDRPYRLDDNTLVMPGTGPDGAFGTLDDDLILVRGLDFPGAASVQTIPLGVRGVGRLSDLVVFGPRCVGWIEAIRDDYTFAGAQQLHVLHDIGDPNQSLQTIDILAADEGGTEGNLEPMGPGRFGLVLTGRDGVWETPDDALGVFVYDPSNSVVTLDTVELGEALRFPVGSRWPRWAGENNLSVLGLGEPGLDFDDSVIVTRDVGGANRIDVHALTTVPEMQGAQAAFDIQSDGRGALVLAAAGVDGVTGTFDDEVIIKKGHLTQRLVPGTALAPGSGEPLAKGAFLDCGAYVFPMYGRQGYGSFDKGVLVVAPASGTSVPATSVLPVFENVARITPMTATSAMMFTIAGQGYHLNRIDTANPGVAPVIGASWAGQSEPVALNPAVIASTQAGNPTPSFSVSDELVFHKVSAVWSYGEATPNGQGYTLEIGSPDTFVSFTNSTYSITMSGAPASALCALFISEHRDRIMITPDAPFLLSAEDMVHAFWWATAPDGTTSVSLPTPLTNAWVGRGGHYQWYVQNPLSARGWELSNGLTVTM